MKLIYTLKSQGLPKGFSARNPRYFVAVERDVKTVIIEGDYPEVEKAYVKAEVEVVLGEVAEGSEPEAAPKPFSTMTVLELKQHLTDQGIEFDAKVTKAQLLELIQE